ncbi:MAG: S8 family serine peptidase, partial [Desulfobacterales bacterium]
FRLIAICCILAAVPVPAATDVPPADRDAQLPAYVPGELLVKFRSEVRQEAAAAYRYWFDITTQRTFAINGYQQVRLPEGTDVEEALELYLEDPDVEHAEPNYIVSANMAPPDDTYFNRLWGLHNTAQNVNGTNGTHDADIDALDAWDTTTGGSNVVVAVIDSGVDVNHPDLQANIWINPAETPNNGIDDDGNGYIDDVNGWDFLLNDKDPRDANGHGTHVAGTIAAIGDNNKGVTGVSWSARIMALRFLDAWGLGSTANAIAAIEYANAEGADVINNSWGGGGYVQALKDAIDASDAVVVCAAGNSGRNNDDNPHYPSGYTSANIIAVAASDQNDQLAAFSNYGAVSVDVTAPGINIYSTAPGRQTVWQDTFSDGDIAGWTTGGTKNSWNATNAEASSDSYSLTDSPGADYLNNTDSYAITPEFDLRNQTASKLEFKIRGSVKSTDVLWVFVSTNKSDWSPVSFQLPGDPNLYNGVSGTFASWTTIEADLEAYDGRSRVWVRFWLVTDGSGVADGYYLDDVKITAASSVYSGDEYTFKHGTSMATPHVSGLAALIIAQHPALTQVDIKALIENRVDLKSALNNKVASDGRINAGAALAAPQISTVQVNSITETTAVVTWTTDLASDSVVQYGTASNSWDSYPNTLSDANRVTSHSITLSGLTQETDYYFRVGSTDRYGNGPDNKSGDVNPSAEATFTTADADPPSIVAFPVINFAADTITVTYDEQDMQGATAEDNYSFSPSLNFGSLYPKDDDISDLGSSNYRLSMASTPAFEIFTLSVSGITDLAGNPVTPASITINDDDGDGMAGDWETANNLNPLKDDSAADLDGDGYSNLQEYQARTDPRSSADAPFIIEDTIPEHNAGITDTQRVPYNTAVAVLLDSAHGIDMTDNASVQFTINDGINPSYTRDLGSGTLRWIKLRAADLNTAVTRMWVVYDRSEESGGLQNFPYGSGVNVKVDVTDSVTNVMPQSSFDFAVETQGQFDAAWAPQNLPDSQPVALDDDDLEGGLDDGVEVVSGQLAGAKIIFDSSELHPPLFGPMDEIPAVTGAKGVGIPMNLQPPAVFDTPVKILIPCPGNNRVGGLNVYYYDGNSWVLAVDAAGNVRAGGDGLVVPGSRVNRHDTDPASIELRVYHFSGFQAGASVASSGGGGGGGGGCFISTASGGSVIGHLILYALFNLALIGLGIYAFNKIMRRR